MTKDTGGPAFPVKGFQTRAGQGFVNIEAQGLSMRDYFAAKAMLGILTATARRDDKNYDEGALALLSYAVADAMLKAREQ